MAKQTDFMSAVNQIAAERGINAKEVLEAIGQAIKTGFKQDYGLGESLVVDINEDTGIIGVYADKKVVEKVTTPLTQISLEDAKKIEPKLKIGDHIQVDITPEGDFGRIAAQAAKQVILQKIRESEKEAVMSEVVDKIGTIESGIVQRMDGDSVIVEVRKANAIMPFEERVPREFYKSGSQIKVILKEIKKGPKGKTLIVSRSAPEFLGELFAIEIPEIMSGSVEIMGIAREAGSRSKISVRSNQPGVDPIGSCVGQRGVRINAIMDELRGEKIDIIVWDEDIREYIANALSPAQVDSIEIDEDKETALVTVPEDQLSLAIGKEGQNVRLAAKLSGWKIDIKGDQSDDVISEDSAKEAAEKIEKEGEDATEDGKKQKEEKKEKTPNELESLGLSARVISALEDANISIEELKVRKAGGTLTEIKGVGPKAADEIESKLT